MDPHTFRLLTDRLPEPYLLLDTDGRIVSQNSRARRTLGTDVGCLLRDFADEPEGDLEAFLQTCSGSASLVPGRVAFLDPEGRRAVFRAEGAALPQAGRRDAHPHHIFLRLRAHEVASGQFILLRQKVAELTQEIHKRRAVEEELHLERIRLEEKARELEAALAEAERQKRVADEANRRKSEFLTSMSHELRTPLHGIVGYVKLLEDGVVEALGPGQEEYVGRIRRAAEHLGEIIRTILSYSRIESGKERPKWSAADSARIASDAMEFVATAARKKGIDLVLRRPEKPVALRPDPAMVRQVLLNLLSNAIKFTPSGTVAVEVEAVGESVEFQVKDSGIGISEGDLEHIFEPFWQADRGLTRESGGTGLGLTVTRRLARLLAGDVEVKSERGRGSVFTLRLPVGSRDGS